MELTAEQEADRLAETIAAAIENRAPDSAAWGFPDDGKSPIVFSDDVPPSNGPAAPPRREAAPNVLRSADLGPALLSACEWYEIPGTGKGVWVYPCSGEAAELVAQWSPHVKFDLDPTEGEQARRERIMGLQISLIYLEVIVVCRTSGEWATSERCFNRADIAAVKRFIPYLAAQEILAISNRLAQAGKPDPEGLRNFFVSVASTLSHWPSRSSTEHPSPNGSPAPEAISELQQRAQRLASFVKPDFGTLCEAARGE